MADEPMPYPKSIFFLIGNEFCERFNYYGLRVVLSLYITEMLEYDERTATIIYHFFAMIVFTMPLFGAMIADSWLGKFKTILYISILYAIGDVVLALSAVKQLQLPPRTFAIIGLALIATGTGGIKPCVAAFGGDQFVLPQQQHQLDGFFHLFYFAINAGSFLSMFITPVLRKGVHCFGEDSCYPLAFLVPGILMCFALILFVMGKPFYRMQPPAGNMILKVSTCVNTAVCTKIRSKGVKKSHWLDFAIEKHGEQIVEEIKVVLGILFLYLPLPLFWALFEQQATGWTFQARQMDGEVGNLFTIFPDQMQVVNPTLILVFIPLFNYFIYPAFSKIGLLRTPLQRIATGGILAGVAYIMTAFLSIAIEQNLPVLPSSGNGQLRIFNILPCTIEVTSETINGGAAISIPEMSFRAILDISVKNTATHTYKMEGECSKLGSGEFTIIEKEAIAYLFNKKNDVPIQVPDAVEKSISGNPNIRTIVNLNEQFEDKPINIKYFDKYGAIYRQFDSSNVSLFTMNFGTYTIQIGDTFKTQQKFKMGGVFTLAAIATSKTEFTVQSLEVTKPNSIHILWLVPQYAVITAGELMLSITGLEFSYSEAPLSMKSVLQAAWLLTIAFGQLFVILIESMILFKRQSAMFFLYAVLMLVDMLIFVLFSTCYKYVNKVSY